MQISIRLFALLLFLGPFLSAQEATVTTWKGTLSVQGTKLRLEVDVVSDGQSISGELRSVDQGNASFKLSDAVFGGQDFKFRVTQIGAEYSGKLNNDKTEADGKFKQSGMTFPLKFTKSETRTASEEETNRAASSFKLKEAWVGELEMGIMKPVMQFRIGTNNKDQTVAFFDSITEGLTDFEAKYEVKDGQLQFKVKKIGLTYTGKLNDAGDEATGIWNQGGRKVELTLKRKDSEIDKGENVWSKRPQKPVGPFPYDSLEVKFENPDAKITLAGTLTVPKGDQRYPAVVLISGSGAQDRDETLMEHKPFLVLADYLSRHGIAVLRYDDRGTAESTGKFAGATSADFATDTAAAVEFLSKHDRINPEAIGLAGHSEGGLIAPMVVGLRDDVAFVVLLAATGVPGTEISISQVEAMLRGEGLPEDSIKIEKATTRAVVETVRDFGKTEAFDSKLDEALDAVIATIPEAGREAGGQKIRDAIANQKPQLKGEWMQYFLSYDPRPALRKIKCPVLAIVGSKDLQVLADLNMPEIEKALREGGNSDFKVITFDGLNHLFQTAKTGSMSEYVSISETFNEKPMKTIADWIGARFSAK